MKLSEKPTYGYRDITIVPEIVSDIASRSEVCPFDENIMLPIIASPMDSVIDNKNWKVFSLNGIYPVIPRSVDYYERVDSLFKSKTFHFTAFSMNEAYDTFINKKSMLYSAFNIEFKKKDKKVRICIDVANGHMQKLLDIISKIKELYGDKIIVMSGNIANPLTYKEYEKAGCDLVRLSIGSGEGCSTTTKTGVHYPIFSLLEETYKIKKEINGKCKIIADGGIREMGDIQKALIYADYVMIGGLFSQMYEASGELYIDKVYKKKYPKEIENKFLTSIRHNKMVDSKSKRVKRDWDDGRVSYYRIFKGMSTKEAQKAINKASGIKGKNKIKESEGFLKKLPVLYSLESWVKEEMSALSSALSYTNSMNLESYKDSGWVINAQRNYN